MSDGVSHRDSPPTGMWRFRAGDVREAGGREWICTRVNESAAYWMPMRAERVEVTRGGATFVAQVRQEPVRTVCHYDKDSAPRRTGAGGLKAFLETKTRKENVMRLELGHTIGWAPEPIVNKVVGAIPDPSAPGGERPKVIGETMRWTVVAVSDTCARIATDQDRHTVGVRTEVIAREINEFYLAQKSPRDIERRANMDNFLKAHAAAAEELTKQISGEESETVMAKKTKPNKAKGAKPAARNKPEAPAAGNGKQSKAQFIDARLDGSKTKREIAAEVAGEFGCDEKVALKYVNDRPFYMRKAGLKPAWKGEPSKAEAK